jgi:two-component system nitrate/nitrite response regulator NarL
MYVLKSFLARPRFFPTESFVSRSIYRPGEQCVYEGNLMCADKKNTKSSASEASGRRRTRILLADNHEVVRDALRPGFLSIADNISLIECGTLDEALELAGKDGAPSLAILGFHMPGMNGLEGVRTFHARFPNVPLAILSGRHCVFEIFKAFDYGAAGFISKAISARGITNAIRLMLSGQRYIPDEVLDAVQSKQIEIVDTCKASPVSSPLSRLTGREREVLGLLIEGYSNKVIGRALGVQEVTVKLHIRKLLRKLGVTNRTQAVTFALQAGWSP